MDSFLSNSSTLINFDRTFFSKSWKYSENGEVFFRDPDFLKRGFRYFSLCMSSIVEAKLNVENSKFRLIKNARKFDFELINKSFLIGTEKNTKHLLNIQ